jgi:hypothetical protein
LGLVGAAGSDTFWLLLRNNSYLLGCLVGGVLIVVVVDVVFAAVVLALGDATGAGLALRFGLTAIVLFTFVLFATAAFEITGTAGGGVF